MLIALPAALLLVALVTAALPSKQVHADQITHRSLELQSGGDGPDAGTDPDGGSQPGGKANHFFTFTLPSVGNQSVGSILFQYCTTATGTTSFTGDCTVPTGLDTTATTVDDTGNVSGFTLVNTTNGKPYVTRTAASVTANTVATIKLLGVINQDATNCSGSENCTFFVRISTYLSTDTTGTPIDTGTVAAATSTQIVLTGKMPESLIFCTGGQVDVNAGGIPDCSTATSGDINFNQLFSPTETAYATSQMAASTNALFGYAITVHGTTLTSGSYTITPQTSPDISTVGKPQFGMNLAADTAVPTTGPNAVTPASANVNPLPNGTNFMGTPSANFGTGGDATAAKYAFDPAGVNLLAQSDNGTGTGAPTDSQIYTSTYIVNVSGSQVAGTYTTTLTYICTPTF
ncbi:MAG TPA: hypothetical protein VFL85_04160 [Candidatus Saccharimonadales bacterium]|nr:hypothetical protein [Candidatus Saccharimonadales bacterium]